VFAVQAQVHIDVKIQTINFFFANSIYLFTFKKYNNKQQQKINRTKNNLHKKERKESQRKTFTFFFHYKLFEFFFLFSNFLSYL
jgi:hypothetical protein